MSKRLVLVMLLSLLLVTAFLLGEGWMAGMAIGSIVLVPFCFLASVLLGQLLRLDRHVRPTDDHNSDDKHPLTFEKKFE